MRARVAVIAGVIAGLAGATPSHAGRPSECGSTVYVNTVVHGTPTAPEGYAFVSDGNTTYLNGGKGSSRVEGRLDIDGCWFDFVLNLNLGNRYTVALLSDGTHASKHFNFDRVASIPVTPGPENTTFGDSGFCAEGVVYTADGKIRRNTDGTYQDNYGGCGSDEEGWYVRRAGTIGMYEGPSRDFRLQFHPQPITVGQEGFCNTNPSICDGLSYLRVYHPTANTWIIRPEDGATAALLKYQDGGYRFQSMESVPFRIEVTRP